RKAGERPAKDWKGRAEKTKAGKCRPSRVRTPRLRARICVLLQGQDPLDQRLGVGVVHLSVGGHRNLAPRAHAALLDLGRQHGGGVSLTRVLGSDFLVSRANQLLVHRVTGQAVLGLGQRLGRKSGRSGEETSSNRSSNESLHIPYLLVLVLMQENLKPSPPRCLWTEQDVAHLLRPRSRPQRYCRTSMASSGRRPAWLARKGLMSRSPRRV